LERAIALLSVFNSQPIHNQKVKTMQSTQLQPTLVKPNQFLLTGYDVEISYETTSFTGTPRFSLTRQGQTLNFTGEEIQTERSQLGQMVTVNLSDNLRAIGVVETLTLLIPSITVLSTTKTAPIQTIAIFNRQSPQIKIAGQSQTYMAVSLAGTANQLNF
jgi:hypothetical protein